MRNLFHLFFAVLLWVAAWFSCIQPVGWVGNVFSFLTWLLFCLVLLVGQSKAAKAASVKSHLDGKHAPAWFDVITYVTVISICAAGAVYWKAFAWTIIAFNDFANRKLAGELKSGITQHN